ncbi:hypothetical protein ACFQHO_40580 [Actinomadura yumaensis]|uniref:hypothetical protein n=1 Tax=Actinomadura yumaensis TaxID=111807 RepID=UPI00360D926B
MSALSESPRRRARPAVLTALTWCLAAAYPAVLYIVMQDGHMGFRVAEVAVALALTVVVFRLLRRRPAAVLALLLLAWTLALMAMRKFEVETAQVALTDAAIAYIAATRSRRYSLTAAGLTLLGQILSAAAFPPGVPGLAARRRPWTSSPTTSRAGPRSSSSPWWRSGWRATRSACAASTPGSWPRGRRPRRSPRNGCGSPASCTTWWRTASASSPSRRASAAASSAPSPPRRATR